SKERPPFAGFIEQAHVQITNDVFLSLSAFIEDAPEGIDDEGMTPKLDPRFRGAFLSDSVDGQDEHSVRDRVRALTRLPGVELSRSFAGFLGGEISDGCGIEQYPCAQEGGDARRFGVPVVPTDERSFLSNRSVDRHEPLVARGEVILLHE